MALTRISTFFSDFHVPVRMQDEDDFQFSSRGSRDEEEEDGWGAIKSEQVSVCTLLAYLLHYTFYDFFSDIVLFENILPVLCLYSECLVYRLYILPTCF